MATYTVLNAPHPRSAVVRAGDEHVALWMPVEPLERVFRSVAERFELAARYVVHAHCVVERRRRHERAVAREAARDHRIGVSGQFARQQSIGSTPQKRSVVTATTDHNVFKHRIRCDRVNRVGVCRKRHTGIKALWLNVFSFLSVVLFAVGIVVVVAVVVVAVAAAVLVCVAGTPLVVAVSVGIVGIVVVNVVDNSAYIAKRVQ